MTDLPAVALAAAPGRRSRALDLVARLEQQGFAGIHCASFGDPVSLCLSIAHLTERIRFGTAIQPIYLRHPFDLAQSAAYIHEVSGGRFSLGVGVSHGPTHERLGVQTGRPLRDTREYVDGMRQASKQVGELPPVVLAALRTRMVELAVEIGDGAIWANAARSHMAASLAHVPDDVRARGFWVGNMVPTVIDDDDPAAAAAVCRKTLTGYVSLPNYRNYWKEAGYEEEMTAIEEALAAGDRDRLPSLMSDRWLADCTLHGTTDQVRQGVAAWYEAGVVPIVVPSSTSGGQLKAFEELFTTFA